MSLPAVIFRCCPAALTRRFIRALMARCCRWTSGRRPQATTFRPVISRPGAFLFWQDAISMSTTPPIIRTSFSSVSQGQRRFSAVKIRLAKRSWSRVSAHRARSSASSATFARERSTRLTTWNFIVRGRRKTFHSRRLWCAAI